MSKGKGVTGVLVRGAGTGRHGHGGYRGGGGGGGGGEGGGGDEVVVHCSFDCLFIEIMN